MNCGKYFFSGNPVIQRIQRNRRRTSSGLGSLSRMSKTSGTKVDMPESSKYTKEINSNIFKSIVFFIHIEKLVVIYCL